MRRPVTLGAMSRSRLVTLVPVVAVGLLAAAGLSACESQASSITSYGRVSQLKPPCITPAGKSQLCFEAMAGQLDQVKNGDCVELRSRPSQGGGLPPIMTIRPIPVASANGACG